MLSLRSGSLGAPGTQIILDLFQSLKQKGTAIIYTNYLPLSGCLRLQGSVGDWGWGGSKTPSSRSGSPGVPGTRTLLDLFPILK